MLKYNLIRIEGVQCHFLVFVGRRDGCKAVY
jgi:hypothetical protein